MTLGVRKKSVTDPWVASAFTLIFSFALAYLQPRYETWFGSSLPEFTRAFLAWAPLWIAINVCAMVVQIVAAVRKPKGDELADFDPEEYEPTRIERLNSWLSFVALLTFLLGVVALILPKLH